MKYQYTIIISGRVQGVGYRYFVRRLALERGATGYVKNHPDGTVEAVIQIDEREIEEMLTLLRKGPGYCRVDRVVVEKDNITSSYEGFNYI